MGLFSKKEKKELVALFDVGSSDVGGALFYKNSNGSPEIIFSVREPIPFQEQVEYQQFLSTTLKSLEEVAKKISLSGLGAPKKTYCVLSSPWYASQTRVVVLEKNTPFVFNTKLADSLIQKEIAIFQEKYMPKSENIDNKVRILELKNMKTMLNGYATDKPIDKMTKKAEMTLFIAMSPEYVLQKIEDSIGRHLHSKGIIFSSFGMASFAVSRDIFIHKDSFLLIDIGGEVTDISMVKKDILRESVSFPMGKNFLLRGIAKAMSYSLEQAQTVFNLYKEGHADADIVQKIKDSLDQVKADWLKQFQTSLVSLSNDITIPSTIFLTADEDVTDWFMETIKNEQFNQYTLTESKFLVLVISTETLHGIANFKNEVARDRFIIIESIYINRFLK